MATGALDSNGIWQYGEDDSETTFSALLNKLGTSISAEIGVRKVLQVVNASTTTSVSVSSTTYVDTGLSATITPRKNTSKILVLVSQQGMTKQTGSSDNGVHIRLFRGTTLLSQVAFATGYSNTNSALLGLGASNSFLDSPSTTSPITYKTQFANNAPFASVIVQDYNARSTITLIEVSA